MRHGGESGFRVTFGFSLGGLFARGPSAPRIFDAGGRPANFVVPDHAFLPGPVKFPVGTVPLPGTRPPIFSDGVFVRGALGRLSGIGAVAIILEEVLIRQIEKRQRARIDDIINRQEEDQRRRDRVRRQTQQIAVITDVLGQPGTIETDEPLTRTDPLPPAVSPQRIPLPQSTPQRVEFPESPTPIGEPETVPVVSPPIVSPVAPPVSIPAPVAPVPVRTFPQRVGDLTKVALPVLPFAVPLISPVVGTPVPAAVPAISPVSFLTPIAGTSVPSNLSPSPAGVTQSLSLTERQCQGRINRARRKKCKKKKKRRTECYSGFFREGVTKTDKTNWTQINCFTGKEIK